MAVDESGERAGQVGQRIDGIENAGLDERGNCSPALCSSVMPQIKKIRAGTKASRAVFASFIDVEKITVAAWEQGTKKPNSTAIKIVDLVERKGLDILR